MACESLAEMLVAAAASRPRQGYTFVSRQGEEKVGFAELLDAARRTAAWLQQAGVRRGDRVVVIVPTGPEFARVFFGLVLCGAAPCVLASPRTPGPDDGLGHVRQVGERLAAKAVITTADEAGGIATACPELEVWLAEQTLGGDAVAFRPVAPAGDDLALVQASSGSTGRPKCVQLTHRNVLANLEQIGRALRFDDDVVVSWLPLYHDMGLIGCFLVVAYWRLAGVFLSPRQFLRRPLDWLAAISRHRGTVSPAPCFAYALAARRATDRDVARLDLSSFRKALCGSEQVDPRTLERFAERFGPAGFRPDALVPCYGLAEATLAVTMTPLDQGLRVDRVSRRALAAHGRALPGHGDDAVDIADCGKPVDGARVAVLGADGRGVPDGRVGRIHVSSPSVTPGYLGDARATAQALRGGWLDTGDLGYLRGGRLFVTGRAKEVIVLRGQNHAPQEFENAARAVPGVRDRVAAFGVADPLTGTEELWILCETEGVPAEEEQITAAVRQSVGRSTGVVPAHVGLVPRNWLPRTTSGKLQRSKARAAYLDRLTAERVA